MLQAGIAEADITPKMGTQLAGDIGRPRPVEEIGDPLFVQALVITDGSKKLCVLSLDILAVNDPRANEFRAAVAHAIGTDFESVMMHVTQTHSAPSIGHFFCRDSCDLMPSDKSWEWLRGGDSDYDAFALKQTIDAATRANTQLEPVEVGAAMDLDDRVAFNRRFIMRDGSSQMGVQDRQGVLQREGPMDPDVSVVSFRNKAGEVLGVMLHHTCHPVHGYPTRVVSADWPGQWRNGMREAIGGRCIPMVINGCCGNIICQNALDPTYKRDQVRMGKLLTETGLRAYEQIKYESELTLDRQAFTLPIPLREVEPELLAEAKQMLADHPEPVMRTDVPGAVEWKWVYAVGRIDIDNWRRELTNFDYYIQGFRIGRIALAAVMGEPFVEAQLDMKRQSPVARTIIAHMSNGYVGYLPTPAALKGGGYETWTGIGSKLVPEALQMVTDATVAMLQDLCGEYAEVKTTDSRTM